MSRFRATPYAKAFHQIMRASGSDGQDAVPELEAVAAAVAEVPQFLQVLVTPMISPEKKTELLEQVLQALDVSDLVRKFVHVIQQHYRMEHMAQIAEVYRELVDRSLGRVRARIEVPVALSKRQQQQLTKVIESAVAAQVVAEVSTNPDLLAGFRIQVGSKVFDGSLVGQLEQLRHQRHFEQG